MAQISLRNLTKYYPGGQVPAVDDVSLDIPAGGFLTLLGPSGCGKSSTLRIVAGLSDPDGGQVLMDRRDVTRLGAQKRNIGMVFQSLALFPHLTVAENVAFGPRMRGVSAADRKARVERVLSIVELTGFAQRYPHQLSGGQQQRVALARAMVVEPSVLILDEPFSALDRKLREAMQLELYRITREIGVTALFVTHDQEEALTLSDQIAVMNHGRVEQCGTPREIFAAPQTRFVAEFMGLSNFLPARIDDGSLEIEGQRFAWTGRMETHGDCDVALRPEGLWLSADAPAGAPALPGVLRQAIYQGPTSSYTVQLPSGRSLVARTAQAEAPAAIGAPVWLSWTQDSLLAFAK